MIGAKLLLRLRHLRRRRRRGGHARRCLLLLWFLGLVLTFLYRLLLGGLLLYRRFLRRCLFLVWRLLRPGFLERRSLRRLELFIRLESRGIRKRDRILRGVAIHHHTELNRCRIGAGPSTQPRGVIPRRVIAETGLIVALHGRETVALRVRVQPARTA